MENILFTFTHVVTIGSSLIHAPVPVVIHKTATAVYPLHIQSNLNGICGLTDGPHLVVETIERHAPYQFHIELVLADDV